jgi:phosphatidylserine decarboxylase
LDEASINNNWPLAREGLPFILVGFILTFLLIYMGFFFVSIVTGIITLFITFFFRDPDRRNDTGPGSILTPADGTILEIKHLGDPNNPLGKPALKISVFMSIFNVHVNRFPVAGTVKKITYQPGKFFRANLDKASKFNENNRIMLETNDSRTIIVIQIAGIIARRIACWIKEGDRLNAGQRFGLIRFGSRLEVYLPEDSRITAKPGQKVKAGETVIGYLS